LHLGGKNGHAPTGKVTGLRPLARDMKEALEAHTYPLAQHVFALLAGSVSHRADTGRVLPRVADFPRRHLLYVCVHAHVADSADASAAQRPETLVWR
jgi:hypothetical protein